MLLIGKILKETVKQGQLRRRRLSAEHYVKIREQQVTLKQIITDSKKCAFVRHYGLQANAQDFEFHFKNSVPLYNYEEFYAQWLHRTINDEANVISSEKISHFALSSGTTNDSSKRIPVSEKMMRHFQRVTVKQIIDLGAYDLPEKFYTSKVLTVGGSTKLTKVKDHFEGDLSGILAKNKSFTLTPFTRPKKKISNINDWNEKLEAMVQAAPKWNIGVVAGVPSWICLLLEAIIERYELESIHDLWPDFALYLHGGVFLEPYKDRINSCLGKEIIYQNTYLASEGYVAYQRNLKAEGMELLTSSGIYYEFVESRYFEDLKNKQLKNIPTLNLSEVKNDEPYALVMTTCSGLWRYIIGDIITFTDINTCTMKILGRISSSLNVLGEHLSEGNLRAAIQRTSQKLQVNIEEFCVYPAASNDRHNWYIGSNQRIDTNKFSVVLNEELSELNDDYATVRKHLLKTPKIKTLPVQKFYEFLEHKKKLGGQNKFPLVMNTIQAKEWERFLTATNFLVDER